MSQTTETEGRKEPERDGNGRYASSINTAANQCYHRIAAFRQTIIETVTEENIVKITKKLIERAENGSETAAKLIFQYAIGKPLPSVDPDRADIEEWNMRTERPTPREVKRGVEDHPPAEMSVVVGRDQDLRHYLAALQQGDASAVEQELKKMAAEDRRKAESNGHRVNA